MQRRGLIYVGFAQIDTWPVALHTKFDERGGGGKTAASNHEFMLVRGASKSDLGPEMQKLGAMHDRSTRRAGTSPRSADAATSARR